MNGNFIDTIRFAWKPLPEIGDGFFYLDTDYGKIRVWDTKGNKPTIINVPDGPNVIEHQLPLIEMLSKNYRVICFEYPGVGLSFPNANFDYSYKCGAALLLQIMNLLSIENTALLFSCSNGYYAIEAVNSFPDRFNHLFLSQTPSINFMQKWSEKSIPSLLKTPIVGQVVNAFSSKKLAKVWYQYALPQTSGIKKELVEIAHRCLDAGGCFCLSSLVQGLKAERHTPLAMSGVSSTMVWGAKDFSHRKTEKDSIKSHIEDCEIIEFENCGHFPELEETKRYVDLIKERLK